MFIKMQILFYKKLQAVGFEYLQSRAGALKNFYHKIVNGTLE